MGRFQKTGVVNERESKGRAEALRSIALLVTSVAVAALALTNQSLWIDEAHSALKAMQPSLASWWQVLTTEKGSDLQMPFYMLWLWAWEKMAGHSELALRAANLPWLLLAHYFLYQAGRRSSLGPFPLLALASLNPFLWAYLNEARPYVMQYAAACVLCAFLFRAAEDASFALKPAGLWIFAGGLLLLCGSSLLGVVWAAFAGVAWLYLVRDRVRKVFQTANIIPLAAAAVGLGVLGLFYFWTLRSGARASGAGKTGLLNLAFVFYELTGAAGLGPGRLKIRQDGFAAFRAMGVSLLPLVAGLFLILALLAHGLVRAWKARMRPAIGTGAIYAIPPVVLLFALGYLQDFRVLGRHFMPVMPVILGLFLLSISAMKRRRAVIFCTALATIWLASSLSLRFAARHQKDDYRSAARLARAALAQGASVWWSADNAAATYYGLPLGESGGSAARPIVVQSPAQLAGLPLPDLVAASKPDLYDPAGQLAEFLRAHDFIPVRDLPAFTIWRKPAPHSEHH